MLQRTSGKADHKIYEPAPVKASDRTAEQKNKKDKKEKSESKAEKKTDK